MLSRVLSMPAKSDDRSRLCGEATDLCGLQHQEPAVGVGFLWHLHVPGMQWRAPRAGRPRELRQARTGRKCSIVVQRPAQLCSLMSAP